MSTPLGWTFTHMRQLSGRGSNGRQVKVILEQAIGPKKRASFVVGQTMLEGDGYTMLYQWGRKDPFPSQDIAATNGIVLITYAPDKYAELIKNPNVFYVQNNNNATPSYFKNRHRIYWDATFNLPSLKIRKTMFDPSPAGYRVPEWEADAFITGSTTSGEVVNRADNFIFDNRGNTAFVKTNVNDGWLFAPYHLQRDNKSANWKATGRNRLTFPSTTHSGRCLPNPGLSTVLHAISMAAAKKWATCTLHHAATDLVYVRLLTLITAERLFRLTVLTRNT